MGTTDQPIGTALPFRSLKARSFMKPRPGPAASHSIPSLTAPSATDPLPDNRRFPQTRASPVRDGLLLHAVPPISPSATAVVRHWRPERQLPTATGPICWNRARTVALPCPSPFVPTPRPHRIGGFGLRDRPSFTPTSVLSGLRSKRLPKLLSSRLIKYTGHTEKGPNDRFKLFA